MAISKQAAAALLEAAERAYLSMLQQPPLVRIQYDRELAMLRDAIAEATNEDPEIVQNRYEGMA